MDIDFPGDQWLRFQAPSAEDPDEIPGQGTISTCGNQSSRATTKDPACHYLQQPEHVSKTRCPSTDEQVKKLWYIYTMEYHSAIKGTK